MIAFPQILVTGKHITEFSAQLVGGLCNHIERAGDGGEISSHGLHEAGGSFQGNEYRRQHPQPQKQKAGAGFAYKQSLDELTPLR
jgi:hypothetical protein